MPLIHLVELDEGVLRPICGAPRDTSDWTTVDDVVTCLVCRNHAFQLTREAPEPDEPAGEPTTTGEGGTRA